MRYAQLLHTILDQEVPIATHFARKRAILARATRHVSMIFTVRSIPFRVSIPQFLHVFRKGNFTGLNALQNQK